MRGLLHQRQPCSPAVVRSAMVPVPLLSRVPPAATHLWLRVLMAMFLVTSTEQQAPIRFSLRELESRESIRSRLPVPMVVATQPLHPSRLPLAERPVINSWGPLGFFLCCYSPCGMHFGHGHLFLLLNIRPYIKFSFVDFI